jgi:hypothetical protein
MPDDYRYDVFLSYRRHPDITTWVRDVLGPKLSFYLGEALGGDEAQVFWDREDIAPGDIWWKKIEQALQTARCVVPIWSPSYFRSQYCVAEWLTFRLRGAGEALTDWGLVVPVSFNDGLSFPKYAREVQYDDFSDFAYDGIARTADPYIAFQKRLRAFAEALAVKVQNAPAFKPTWPAVQPADVVNGTVAGLDMAACYVAGKPRINRVVLAA